MDRVPFGDHRTHRRTRAPRGGWDEATRVDLVAGAPRAHRRVSDPLPRVDQPRRGRAGRGAGAARGVGRGRAGPLPRPRGRRRPRSAGRAARVDRRGGHPLLRARVGRGSLTRTDGHPDAGCVAAARRGARRGRRPQPHRSARASRSCSMSARRSSWPSPWSGSAATCSARRRPRVGGQQPNGETSPSPNPSAEPGARPRDIYYFILDAYGAPRAAEPVPGRARRGLHGLAGGRRIRGAPRDPVELRAGRRCRSPRR